MPGRQLLRGKDSWSSPEPALAPPWAEGTHGFVGEGVHVEAVGSMGKCRWVQDKGKPGGL